MKHIILLISLFFALSSSALAEDTFYTADPSKAQKGLIIAPLSETHPTKETLAQLDQQKSKGYVEQPLNNAIEMIKLSKTYHKQIDNNAEPTDTHIKSDLSKIKLAFKFTPVGFLKSYGFVVGGMYIQDQGWTAVTSFFNDKDMGACDYKVNNMKLSQGAVRIPKEIVRYDVNNKATTVYVEGSSHSGFVYNVNWNDDTNNYFLECANMSFDKNMTSRMIELAKKIDKNIS